MVSTLNNIVLKIKNHMGSQITVHLIARCMHLLEILASVRPTEPLNSLC